MWETDLPYHVMLPRGASGAPLATVTVRQLILNHRYVVGVFIISRSSVRVSRDTGRPGGSFDRDVEMIYHL